MTEVHNDTSIYVNGSRVQHSVTDVRKVDEVTPAVLLDAREKASDKAARRKLYLRHYLMNRRAVI